MPDHDTFCRCDECEHAEADVPAVVEAGEEPAHG